MQPIFPVFVLSIDDDDWMLDTPQELANYLEWFDSEDGDDSVVVVDWDGRALVVQIEALQIKRLEVRDTAPIEKYRGMWQQARLKAA